jgi:glutamate synthase domain-containing protein 1
MVADTDGTYVLYADHVEALRQAEQRGMVNAAPDRAYDLGYEQGQREALATAVNSDAVQGAIKLAVRDALAAAVQRVEALPTDHDHRCTCYVCWQKRKDIAAIKGEQA